MYKPKINTFSKKETLDVYKIFIYCEGETEQSYFEGIKAENKNPKVSIKIVSKTKIPIGLAKTAVADKKIKGHYKWDKYYIVFDRDSHEKIQETIAEAEKNKINWVITNPCIEFWFYIHFCDHNAEIERDKIFTKLSKLLSWYKKTYDKELFKKLSKSQNYNNALAVERSQRLLDHHKKVHAEIKEWEWNPYTKMPELLKEIIDSTGGKK